MRSAHSVRHCHSLSLTHCSPLCSLPLRCCDRWLRRFSHAFRSVSTLRNLIFNFTIDHSLHSQHFVLYIGFTFVSNERTKEGTKEGTKEQSNAECFSALYSTIHFYHLLSAVGFKTHIPYCTLHLFHFHISTPLCINLYESIPQYSVLSIQSLYSQYDVLTH